MKYAVIVLALSCLGFSKVKLADQPKMTFTGYKFTEKAGVSGTFKKIDWTYNKEAESLEDTLKGAKFKIDSHSIDAGKVARNINITNGLFKNWGGRYIEGEVVEVDKKNKFLKAMAKIGEKSYDLFFQYSKAKDQVILTGSIDLLRFGMVKAFNKLHKLCYGVHKGKDGISKTWSTVDLKVVANIIKE